MRSVFLKIISIAISLWYATEGKAQTPEFPGKDPAVSGAHVGIYIYDPSTGKKIYEQNSDKYFLPASTLKIFSLYVGLKFLGDSLPGIKIKECKDFLEVEGTGDPSLLHPQFTSRSVMKFLTASSKPIIIPDKENFKSEAFGPGWSWEDYEEAFMPERSAFPLYGNLTQLLFKGKNTFLIPDAGMKLILADQKIKTQKSFSRKLHSNEFTAGYGIKKDTQWKIPFITSAELSARMLADTLHKQVAYKKPTAAGIDCREYFVKSIPTDSLLMFMMHESDNFFAEQILMMVSYLRYGYFDEKKLIDDLLGRELAGLPQKPRWIDGSGLSRYNLVTPQDHVYMLEKMEKEFGSKRLQTILPTGGKGTLKGLYISSQPYIFAKTGTVSNNSGLCGYLKTQKGKTLIFSIFVSNYPGKAGPVRRLMESYLQKIKNSY